MIFPTTLSASRRNIVKAAGKEEVAAFRQLADEEAERRGLAHAADAIGAQHGEFIEIGEQTVAPPRASADPRIGDSPSATRSPPSSDPASLANGPPDVFVSKPE